MTEEYLKQIADNTTEANDKLEEIHEAIELSGVEVTGYAGEDPPAPGPAVPLSYLIQKSQYLTTDSSLGHAMALIMQGFFGHPDASKSYHPPFAPFVWKWDRSKWTKKSMKMLVVDKWVGEFASITYNYLGMDQDESAWNDGKEQIVDSQMVEQPANGWLIDLTTADDDLPFEREESVTLTAERSVEMASTTEIDVGVSSETTIGGSLFGVSLEEKITASFGYKDTEEERQARSDTKATETSTKIAYTCPRERITLLTIKSTDINSKKNKSWHGVPDYGITISFNNNKLSNYYWAPKLNRGPNHKDLHTGWHEYHFSSMNDFLTMLEGTNTDWPGMLDHGGLPPMVKQGLAMLIDGDNRRIDLDGIEERHYQQGADISVEDVTGQGPQDVLKAHGIPEAHLVTN